MVLIGVNRKNEESWIFLASFVETFDQFTFDVFFEPFAARLSAPDNMILELIGAMLEMFGFHETSLPYIPLAWNICPGYYSSPHSGQSASHYSKSTSSTLTSVRGFLVCKKEAVGASFNSGF